MSTVKLLTESELDAIEMDSSKFGSAITSYADNIQKVIDSFNDAAVVQAFYSTGRFGQAQKERLVNIAAALRKYASIVAEGDSSLVGQTKKYVARQRELNNSGTSGGAGIASSAVAGAAIGAAGAVSGGAAGAVSSGVVGAASGLTRVNMSSQLS